MTITEHIAAVRREMAEAARETQARSERDIFLVGASKMNDAAACQEAHRRRSERSGGETRGAGDDRQAGSERL